MNTREYYTEIDGSVNWPDWSGAEECAGCDNSDLPDIMEGDCPQCGTPWWHTIASHCDNCDDAIMYWSDTYYSGECGETLCQACYADAVWYEELAAGRPQGGAE